LGVILSSRPFCSLFLPDLLFTSNFHFLSIALSARSVLSLSGQLLRTPLPAARLVPPSPSMAHQVTQDFHGRHRLIAPYFTIQILSASLLSTLLLVFALQRKARHPTLISVSPFFSSATLILISGALSFLTQLIIALILDSALHCVILGQTEHPSESVALASTVFALSLYALPRPLLPSCCEPLHCTDQHLLLHCSNMDLNQQYPRNDRFLRSHHYQGSSLDSVCIRPLHFRRLRLTSPSPPFRSGRPSSSNSP